MGSEQRKRARQAKRYRRPGMRKTGRVHSKIGRPFGTFKEVDTAKLISDISRGVPVTIACAAVGIHKDTFASWLDERPEFAQALAAEKQRVILEWLTSVLAGTKEKERRGAAWALEHVYPDYFAPPDKGPLFAQNVFTITYEKAREIEQTRNEFMPNVQARLGLSTDGNGTT
jgi:hypothetical protein